MIKYIVNLLERLISLLSDKPTDKGIPKKEFELGQPVKIRIFISGSRFYEDKKLKYKIDKHLMDIQRYYEDEYNFFLKTWFTPRDLNRPSRFNQSNIDKEIYLSDLFVGIAHESFGEYTEGEWYKAFYGLTKSKKVKRKYRHNKKKFDYGEVYFFNWENINTQLKGKRGKAFLKFIDVADSIPVFSYTYDDDSDDNHFNFEINKLKFGLIEWVRKKRKEETYKPKEPVKPKG